MRRKSTRSPIHSKSEIEYQPKKPESTGVLRNDSHESGAEKQSNQSKTRLRTGSFTTAALWVDVVVELVLVLCPCRLR
jgi:hypothetical protein